MTSSIPRLPQELYDEIISYLSSDHMTLRACALACRPFLGISRRQLFSDVTIQINGPSVSTPHLSLKVARLAELLKYSPHLGSYVKRLYLYSTIWDENNDPNFGSCAFCLHYLRKVQHLTVDISAYHTMDESHGMLVALSDAISSPLLTGLAIQSLPLAFFEKYIASKKQCSPESLQLYTRWLKGPRLSSQLSRIVTTYLRQSVNLKTLQHLGVGRVFDPRDYQDIFSDTLCKFSMLMDLEINITSTSDYKPDTINLRHFKVGLRRLCISQTTQPMISKSINTVYHVLGILQSLSTPSSRHLEYLHAEADYTTNSYNFGLYSPSWVEFWTYALDMDLFPRLKTLEMRVVGAGDIMCGRISEDLKSEFDQNPCLKRVKLCVSTPSTNAPLPAIPSTIG